MGRRRGEFILDDHILNGAIGGEGDDLGLFGTIEAGVESFAVLVAVEQVGDDLFVQSQVVLELGLLFLQLLDFKSQALYLLPKLFVLHYLPVKFLLGSHTSQEGTQRLGFLAFQGSTGISAETEAVLRLSVGKLVC
jgi:hypothetical protein